MTYQIKLKEIEPMRIAYINFHGEVYKAKKFFPKVFRSIKGKTNGSPFFNYLSLDPKTKLGDMELCIPTLENPNSDSILIKTLPKTKVLSTIHIGAYKNIMDAYSAIHKYSLEKDIDLEANFREIFIKGPGMIFKGNSNNYITEIQFIVKED